MSSEKQCFPKVLLSRLYLWDLSMSIQVYAVNVCIWLICIWFFPIEEFFKMFYFTFIHVKLEFKWRSKNWGNENNFLSFRANFTDTNRFMQELVNNSKKDC